MSDLFHDAWHDLREKRLWPVALMLLLAIVAVPVVLTKSAGQTPPAPTAASETAERTAVTLDGADAASTGAGSSLSGFAEGDPFTPPDAIAEQGGTSGVGIATPASSGASDGGATNGGVPGGDDGGSSPTPAPEAPVDPAPPVAPTETTEYQYVADVTFWTGERRRRLRGLRKLDMLPNQRAPVLIFMGTAGNGGNAVFLVDSTLKAAGEGHCVPGPSNCAYVHVGPGSEHAFTTEEGDSYRLRIDEIRRVEVKAAARAGRAARRASADDGRAARRFDLPSLVDLVAVTSSGVDGDSSVAAGGR